MNTHTYEVWIGAKKVGNFRAPATAARCAKRSGGRIYRSDRREFWGTQLPWEFAAVAEA